MSNEKPQIDVFMIGDVDVGKTTIAGYLMWHSGDIDPTTMTQAQSVYEKDDVSHNKYVLAMNSYRLRRNKSVHSCNPELTCSFQTSTFRIHMDDASHIPNSFIKILVTEYGKQLTLGILVVSASFGEFEAGISRTGLARTYMLLAFEFNIDPLVILVNKMDQTHPKYSEDRFNEIRTEILQLIKRFEHNNSRTIVFIPVSGIHGDNLMEQSKNMPWYNGWMIQRPNHIGLSGKIFLDIFDAVLPSQPSLKDKPLRLIVTDVFTVREHGKICLGRVESGTLKKEMIISITPSDVQCQIKTIEQYHAPIEEAVPGDPICFSVGNITQHDIRRGSIVFDPNSERPSITRSFTVKVYIINFHREMKSGFVSTVEFHKNSCSCRLVELMEKIDIRTGKIIEKNPSYLRMGDVALVKFKPLQPTCLQIFPDYPQLDHICLRDMNEVVAIGRLKYVEKQNGSSVQDDNFF